MNILIFSRDSYNDSHHQTLEKSNRYFSVIIK